MPLQRRLGPHDRGVLLGVVHLPPLPGSPRYAGRPLDDLVEIARRDVDAILDAGFDGFVLENFGDVPFFPNEVPRHVLTCMTAIACALPSTNAIVVVNVLRNDAAGALAVAAATNADAIRVNVHTGAMVTDQGIVEGRAAETLRLRAAIAPSVSILADVDVKHATPLSAGYRREGEARDAVARGLADGLIVTGAATGSPPDETSFESIRSAAPETPILIGSGVTPETAAEWYARCAGIIVGTSLKEGGRVDRPVDLETARAFVAACRGTK